MQTEQDITLINDKAVKKVLYDNFFAHHKSKFQADPRAYIDLYVQPESKAAYEIEINGIIDAVEGEYQSNTKKLSPQKTVAFLVTFRPEDEIGATIDWLQLKDWFLKPRKGIKKVYICLEQASPDPEQIYGVHIHAVLILNKEDPSGEVSRVARLIVDKLKAYKTKTTKFLDIKRVSQDSLEDKINYVKGDKYLAEKAPAMQVTDEWRLEMGYLPWWEL